MKKRYLAVLMAGIMLLASAGCGSSSKGTDTYAVTEESAAEYEAAAAEAPAEMAEGSSYDRGIDDTGAITSENGIEAVAETGRKLIKTVYLSMQTKEFDSVLEGLSARVQEIGGYIENSSISGSSYYYEGTRNAFFAVRVPSDRLDEFVEVVGSLGNVTQKNESVEDVTLQYVDAESRKKTLETEQDRLLELLGQAENMEDLLAIESKLSEVRYELENYGSQLRLLDNQIDYSTVNVDITEVERITEVKERTFFEEIADRFSDSLYVVGRGLRGFVIGFLGSLPILAVWAVVIGVIVLLIRKLLRGKKKDRRLFGRKKASEESPSDPKS